MKRWLLVLMLGACSPVVQMPAPIAFPGACPEGDGKCQRNLDAQTLHYIGESDAAVMLMCQDKEVGRFIESCG
jgi:hypothetical protein